MFILGLIAWTLLMMFFVCAGARWERQTRARPPEPADGAPLPRWINSANDRAMEYLLRGPKVAKWGDDVPR